MRVQQLLRKHGVPFEMIHSPSIRDSLSIRDSFASGRTVVVEGEPVAKTVILRVDETVVLAVLPATHLIDLALVKQIMGAERVELSTEQQFNHLLPDLEVGAVPPFGRRYGMITLVDLKLAAADEIVFEGSVHGEAIRMKFSDYVALESPMMECFSYCG